VTDLVDLKRLLGGGASPEEDPEQEEIEEIELNLLESDVVANTGLEVSELVERISTARFA
jgi:hypothetical protein